MANSFRSNRGKAKHMNSMISGKAARLLVTGIWLCLASLSTPKSGYGLEISITKDGSSDGAFMMTEDTGFSVLPGVSYSYKGIGGGYRLVKSNSGTLNFGMNSLHYGATSVLGGTLGVMIGPDVNHTVTGNGTAGSAILTSAGFILGESHYGSLTITNGGSYVVGKSGDIHIGSKTQGAVTVSGAGSKFDSYDINFTNNIYVGHEGTGDVTVKDGAAFTASKLYLGGHDNGGSHSKGTLTIEGAGSQLAISPTYGRLYVGYTGEGEFNLLDGGYVNSGMHVGVLAGSEGNVKIHGANSRWVAANGHHRIGMAGTGKLAISNGGVLENYQTSVGDEAGGSGSITISDAGSSLQTSTSLNIGVNGTGVVTVKNHGTVGFETAGTKEIALGVNSAGIGTMTVENAGSIHIGGGYSSLQVGRSGKGYFNLLNGGSANVTAVYAGYQAGSEGEIVVGGNATEFSTGVMYIGYSGDGKLEINNGGSVTSGGALGVGYNADAKGSILVDGSGSLLTLSSNTATHTVGSFGEGSLSIANGGKVDSIGRFCIGGSYKGSVTVDGANSHLSLGDSLTVGMYGSGKLEVANAGKATTGVGKTVLIGDGKDGDGDVTVKNADSLVSFGGDVNIGRSANAKGSLSIIDGGKASVAGNLSMTSSGGTATSSALVSGHASPGSASTLNVGGSLTMGQQNNAELRIDGGGKVSVGVNSSASSKNFIIANGSGNSASVFVDGVDAASSSASTLSTAGDILVGKQGVGILHITNGGEVRANQNAYINENGSKVKSGVLVSGTNSLFSAGGTLRVAYNGEGTLDVAAGGKVEVTGDILLGHYSKSVATATVSGANSLLDAGGKLQVGNNEGSGDLSIKDGGNARAAGDVNILHGASASAAGAVRVGLNSSLVSTNGNVNVGRSQGVGKALLSGSGTVTANTVTVYKASAISAGDGDGQIGVLNVEGDLSLQTGSTVSVDLGSSNSSDRIDVSGSITAANGIYVDLSSLATGSYTIAKATSGVTYTDASAVITLNGEAIPTGGSGRFSGFSSSLVKGSDGGNDTLKLDITATVNNIALTWDGNTGDAWDLATENWKNTSTTATTFFAGDSVTFDKAGGGAIAFSGGAKTVADMTVAGAGDWEFSGGILADASQSTIGDATGKLKMTGTGSVTLNADSAFRGGIEVDAGTLKLVGSKATFSGDGTIASGAALSLADGAYFGNASGTGTATVKAPSGNAHSLIVKGVNNTIQAGSIAIDSNAVIAFDAASLSNSSAALVLRGTLTNASIGSQTVGLLGSLPGGLDRLRLITVDDATYLADAPGGSILQDGVALTDGSLGLVKDAGIASLILAKNGVIVNTDLTWTGADASHPMLWDVGGANNWNGVVDGVAATRFASGDTVVFGDGGAGQIVVAANGMAGSVIVADMRVDNSIGKDYTFSGGGIVGEGTLLKEGVGTVAFANNASFSKTSIKAGKVQVGNGGGTGCLDSDVDVASGAVLAFNRTGELVHSGAIEGLGSVEKHGAGTVTLSGTVFVKDATVADGTLGIAEDNTVRLSGTLTINSGASVAVIAGNSPAIVAESIHFAAGSTFDISGIAGSALGQSVTLATTSQAMTSLPEYTIGGAALVDYLTARLDFADADKMALVAVMDLSWNDTHKNAGGQYDLAHGTFTIGNEFNLSAALADRTGTFASGWDGKTLTKKSSGKLVLSAANTYSGDTVIDMGSVRLIDGGTLGNGEGKVVFANASTQLAVAKGCDWELRNELSGMGSLRVEMSDDKTLAVTHANSTFGGGIDIESGNVKLTGNGSLGTGEVSIQSGTSLVVAKADDFILGNALNGVGELVIDSTNNTAVVSLTSANSGYTGRTTVRSGILRLSGNGNTGSGAIDLAATSSALEIANGTAVSNSISGAGKIIKTGVDAASLSGSNSYLGGTEILGGKLTAFGASALGGDGTATSPIFVARNAELETQFEPIDSNILSTFFSRVSLDNDAVFTATFGEDTAIRNDLTLASSGSGSRFELQSSNKTLTLDNSLMDVGVASLRLAKGSTLMAHGAAGIAASQTVIAGGLVLPAGSALHVDGDVEFGGGASIAALASSTNDIGRLSATGSIAYAGSGSENVRVYFGDNADIYHGQSFLHADSGITGVDWLKNDFYKLELRAGTDVFINGTYSFNEIMDNLFGPDDWSTNIQEGANYIDNNWDSFSSDLQGMIFDYIETLDNPNLNNSDKRNAFLQLYGEYAAEAGAAHHASLFRFTHMVNNFIQQQYLTDRLNSTLADASGPFSGTALASAALYDRRDTPLANRIWASGFGAWAKQKKTDNIGGFKYNSTGFMLGYDHWFDDRFQVGFAAAYTKGRTKVHELATKYDSDILNVGLYGKYIHESNVYASASLGFVYGWNEYDVSMISGGKRHADYHSRSYSTNIELGYVWEAPNRMNITPYAGVNYSHNRDNGWQEKATNTPIANWFGKRTTNTVDIPIGVRLDKVIPLANGSYLVPEIKAAWIHSAGDNSPSVNTGFVGTSAFTTMKGVNPGKNRWQFGIGLKARINQRFAAQFNYDFEVRKKYTEHNLTVGVGVNF